MKRLLNIFCTGLIAVTLGFGLAAGNAHAQDSTVMEVVDSNEELGTFADLLAETKLPDLLNQEGPFTIIAPTDEAFEKSGLDADQLKNNTEKLQTVVVSHLFRGVLSSDQVESNTGAPVKEGDVEASNGVVHVVDDVVQPRE